MELPEIPEGWTRWGVGDEKPFGRRVRWLNMAGHSGEYAAHLLNWGDKPENSSRQRIVAYLIVGDAKNYKEN